VNIDILYENIGKNYTEDLLGCVMPVYLMYSKIPKYEYKDDSDYFMPLVKEHFDEIQKEELAEGDLIILNTPKCHHFCIYAGKNKIFHCTEDKSFRLSKIDKYLKYVESYNRYKSWEKH
jgi:cell wall-associated NlpC family hydrolase